MSKHLRRNWFSYLGGVYGLSASMVGADFRTPAFWVGMAFGVVTYVGCALGDRP
jgi:hypothetical protein